MFVTVQRAAVAVHLRSFPPRLGPLKIMATATSGTGFDNGNQEYERAVTALNGLQTSAHTLELMRGKMFLASAELEPRSKEEQRYHQHPNETEKLLLTVEYLERCNMKLSDLDRLNAIHVTGTKGKGSVCAMCESILRRHGFKTGFFSSPHLLEVRERIRLNGRPLSKAKFVFYFWECYSMLERSKLGMPTYFKFLTIMAFYVFLKEKTDVAVVEVGIGGAFDCTNIIPKPAVCAISSLDYDHMDVLGDTLEKIAWQKGGIFKRGTSAFTSPQLPSVMRILAERATELETSSLHVVPPLRDYPLEGTPTNISPLYLGLAGEHQKLNASLAVQACQAWLQQAEKQAEDTSSSDKLHSNYCTAVGDNVPVAHPFTLPQEFRQGLAECRWPGRNQIIKRKHVTYYLDGAHTPQSLKACSNWFTDAASQEAKALRDGRGVVRVLMFNITKKRYPKCLMQSLLDCGFSFAAFTPNIAFTQGTNSADQTNLTVTFESLYAAAKFNHQAWLEVALGPENLDISDKRWRAASAPGHTCNFTEENARVFSCISDVTQWCESKIVWTTACGLSPSGGEFVSSSTVVNDQGPLVANGADNDDEDGSVGNNNSVGHRLVQVLVTGSLHLVGVTMTVLGCKVEDF